VTNASIIFPGGAIVPGSNVRPVIACTALAPPGVLVTSGDPFSPLPSRIVNIGPINLEAFRQGNPLTLRATPTDPEGATLRILWSVRDSSGLGVVDDELVGSGGTVSRVCGKDNPGCNPSRGGIYTVYATVYDNFNLFDECRWNITVFPNTPPTILTIVDDRVIDFGRLDGGGVTPDRRVLGVGAIPPGTGNLCTYVPPLTTVLKTLPTIEGSPVTGPPFFPGSAPHIAPTQYPDGMTCVFAVVADANLDPLCGGFTLPLPLYGRGTVYAAIPVPAAPIPILDSDCLPTGQTVASLLPGGLPIGAMIDTQAKMDAYNATLFNLANAGLLPSPFAANGSLLPATPPFGPGQALPIVFEAPDDPDVPLTTHDCRHSADCATLLPRGGTINVEARVTDGYSAERRDFGLVIFPDVVTVFPSGLTLSVEPNPPDPGPFEGVTVTGCVIPEQAGITIVFSIVGTDGFTRTRSPVTGADGCADFFIPGGAEGVVDVVTVTVPVQPGVLSAITTIVSYTF
jgi:hypothetical protein